jgi:hypothetical protein
MANEKPYTTHLVPLSKGIKHPVCGSDNADDVGADYGSWETSLDQCPKCIKVEATKAAARKIYQDRLADGECLTVFSHSTPGVPTLGTMSEIAKELGGEIHHSGFGLFYCKVGSRKIFFFDAGGSMTRVPTENGADNFSWGVFSIENSATEEERAAILAAFDAELS